MPDLRSILDRADRAVSRVPLADDGLEGLRRRRDRRRRDERITAGVVGIVVFAAAVWVVTSGAPSDRRPTPGGTSPTVAPRYPGQVGVIGLAPKGAAPSSPRTGELVLEFGFGHTAGDSGGFRLYVYADGRLIWRGRDDPSVEGDATGLIEQRLTQEGVELVRSEVLSTGLFDHGSRHLVSAHGLYGGQIEVWDGDRLLSLTWGDAGPGDGPKTMPTIGQASALERLDARLEDLASWLPASGWEDPEIRAFVPSRYMVCFKTDQEVGVDAALASLSRPAEDVVRGWDWTAHEFILGYFWWCSPATTDEARALAKSIEDAGKFELVSRDVFGLEYELAQRDPVAMDVGVSFEPMLPHDP